MPGYVFSLDAWRLKKKKNREANASMIVLFIMADNLNNDLGFYGNTEVQTPNLNKLASEGVFFNRAYSQSPICGPSRVSLLTSLCPETTNVIINDTDSGIMSQMQLLCRNSLKTTAIFQAGLGKFFTTV